MAVDRSARDILINMICGVLQGRIGRRTLDRWACYYALGQHTDDPAVVAVAVELRRVAGGLRDKTLNLSPAGQEGMGRTLVFLGTDLEFDPDQDDSPADYYSYFPFATPSQWKSHRHLRKDTLQPFDPNIRPPAANIRELKPILLLMAAILLFIILFFVIPTYVPSLRMKLP